MFLKFLILVAIHAVYVEASGQKDYGIFNLTITRFDICKGPKQKECAISKASVSNYSTLLYEVNVLQNVSPTKGKIVATTKGKEFMRLQVKKPCEHLFLKPLLTSLLNITKDCLVTKGHYKFNVDILGIAQSYFGGTFVFGTWTFKSVFFNERNRFMSPHLLTLFTVRRNVHWTQVHISPLVYHATSARRSHLSQSPYPSYPRAPAPHRRGLNR